ncbi:hypothetical protein HKX48_006264 [Thoreauomyces humboldtii]|nr:hypothetical protein HKX48_006264 [Thoreauomyces humboldtii]
METILANRSDFTERAMQPSTPPPSYALECPAYCPGPSSYPAKKTNAADPHHASVRLPSHGLGLSPDSSDRLNDFMRWGIAPPSRASPSSKKRAPKSKPAHTDSPSAPRTPADRAGVTHKDVRTHFNNFLFAGWAPPLMVMQKQKSKSNKVEVLKC